MKAIKKPIKCPECPDEFTVEFARKLVEYLGGDPAPIKNDWDWEKLV